MDDSAMATFEEFNERFRGRETPPLNAIWCRAGARCEYCGADLLESHHAYRGANSDHILPQRRYPLLINKLNNYAMACASCHKLKEQVTRFDPGEGNSRWQEVDDLTDDERTTLIDAVKARIAPLHKLQNDEIDRAREFLRRHFPAT
jgi:hypothetical protein